MGRHEDTGELVPVIVLPGGSRSCTSDANPHAYVVAVERRLLPAELTVSLGLDGLSPECCPEAWTEVVLPDM